MNKTYMQLIRAIDAPETPRDHVFRASRLHAILFVLICVCACAAILLFHWPRPHLAYYLTALIVIVLLMARHFVTARFHPLNWLARIGDEGVFLHFRSYLNDHLSPEDPIVVFLAYPDIRSARLVQDA